MAIFSRKSVHSVEPPRVAAAGDVQVNEYHGLDLATKNGTYTLKAKRIGQAVTLSRRGTGEAEYMNGYSHAHRLCYLDLTIDPDHLEGVIGLLTVARDKMVGAR